MTEPTKTERVAKSDKVEHSESAQRVVVRRGGQLVETNVRSAVIETR